MILESNGVDSLLKELKENSKFDNPDTLKTLVFDTSLALISRLNPPSGGFRALFGDTDLGDLSES